MVTFWATIGNIGLLLILTSGRTGRRCRRRRTESPAVSFAPSDQRVEYCNSEAIIISQKNKGEREL